MKINLSEKTTKILKWAGLIGAGIVGSIFSQSLNDDAAKAAVTDDCLKEGWKNNLKK